MTIPDPVLSSSSSSAPASPVKHRTSKSFIPSVMDATIDFPSDTSSSKAPSVSSTVSSFVSNWLFATFGSADEFIKMSGIVLFGLLEFAWWLFVFVRMMNEYLQGIVDPTSREWLRALGANVPAVLNTNSTSTIDSAAEVGVEEHVWRESIDVWFGMASIAAIDAFTVVLNFNRSLLHQWHYYVSLRMMSSCFLVSYLWMYPSFKSLVFMGLVYTALYMATEWLHKFLPVRGVRIGHGSPAEFSNHMSLFEVPWVNAIFYAAVNGAFGLTIVFLMPRTFAFINPVIHITWEVCFLGWMKTRQTGRYILFATPFVQAATAFDWGITQCMVSPKMYLDPAKFIMFAFLARVLLDLHLKFLGRADFNWARNNCITSTKSYAIFFGLAYLLEINGIPVITLYYKFVVILGLHAFGVLVFLIPAAYCIVKRPWEANEKAFADETKEKELAAKKLS